VIGMDNWRSWAVIVVMGAAVIIGLLFLTFNGSGLASIR